MDPRFVPGSAAAACTSKVELAIKCRDLLDMDVFSKSDPMVVMYTKQDYSNEWREYGRTETIWNTLNPDFVKKFVIDYFFEERQHLRFQVYDIDNAHSSRLSDHDFLGSAEFTLGEVVSHARGCKRRLMDDKGRPMQRGTIIVSSEEQSTSKEELVLSLFAKGLDKKDWFGKSDPYLAFYKINEDSSLTVVHRTEVIKNTLNPHWKPMCIPLKVLCNGDKDRLIHVKCFDWNRNGDEDLIGQFFFTVNEIMGAMGPGTSSWEVINPVKAKKKSSYKNSGIVGLNGQPKLMVVPTFLDYVSAGTQLQCTIAIDFTASNGNPLQPGTLHYLDEHRPNQYQRALRAVGEVIQDYDSDQVFPVIGFGARLPPEGNVSHNFNVNFKTSADCQGLPSVMQAYATCLRQIQLYGPTNFAPIINRVASAAARHLATGQEYNILLMITDGIITDMPQTRNAIVAAAHLPLSIIIVGVGSADFDAMEELDGDEVRLTDMQGRKAVRDIVQFVPFRDFIDARSAHVSQARLAQAVLAEIPDQFLSFMKSRNIKTSTIRRQSTTSFQSHASVSSSINRAPSQQRPLTAGGGGDMSNGLDANEPPPPYPGY